MKSVVMIAPYFIPRRRVGALRPFKFAVHLNKYGYQPTVITLANPGSNKTSKEKSLLEGIEVIEISSPIDRTQPSGNSNKKENNRSASGISDTILGWIDKQTPVDTWIFLFKARYNYIAEEVQKINPDILWATGDPWSGLWLGHKLSTDLGIPFIADFRDPWTITKVNLRERSVLSAGLDQGIEKKIIEGASKLVFTSRLTEKNYKEHYQFRDEKADTIYNSFDLTLAEQGEKRKWKKNLNSDHLNLIFFGRFRRLSPVNSIANALSVMKSEYPEELPYIRIHSFGMPDKPELDRIQELGLEPNFQFHEPVVPEETRSVLISGDLLLLSTNMEREEIIPAKLWDYLSVDIPIVSIAPNPEVGEIIMRSKAGIQLQPEEKDEIAELLHRFVRAKLENETGLFMPEFDIPDRSIYEARHTTGQLASIFDKVIGSTGAKK